MHTKAISGLLAMALLATWALTGRASGWAPQATVSGGVNSRTCGTESLSCEQLVALGLTYPYPREPGSYLFVNGVAYPYERLGHRSLMDATVRAGHTVLSARTLLQRLGLGDQVDQARTPVIAYGSNANVEALTRKFVTSSFSAPAVVPVIKGTLKDVDVTWSPHLVFNGAMPATIVSSPGTTVSVWVTWLDSVGLQEMNATEGVGSLYSYGVLSGARLDVPGPSVTEPGIYVDCFGALRINGRVLAIRDVPATHRRFSAVRASGALSRAAAVLGWPGSVFDLLLENVQSPELRASRSSALNALSIRRPLPGYTPTSGCA